MDLLTIISKLLSKYPREECDLISLYSCWHSSMIA